MAETDIVRFGVECLLEISRQHTGRTQAQEAFAKCYEEHRHAQKQTHPAHETAHVCPSYTCHAISSSSGIWCVCVTDQCRARQHVRLKRRQHGLAAILCHHLVESRELFIRHPSALSTALDDVVLHTTHHGDILSKYRH